MHRQVFQHHPTIGYQFIPGLKARIDTMDGAYLVRVNSSGFRCEHEFAREKSSEKYRILLFGDSITAGDMVANKDRYGDQLERLLPSLEVYNFGLPGSGTDQQYLIYRDIAAHFEHDLLLIGVMVENIRRVVARYRPATDQDGREWLQAKPYFILRSDGELELHGVPVPKDPISPELLPASERAHVDTAGRFPLVRRAINALGGPVKDLAQRLTRFQPLPAYDSPNDPAWILMKTILTRWIKASKVPVIICPIPLYQYIEQTSSPERYQVRFRELEALPRVKVHDPLPDFWKVSADERRGFRFKYDLHPTPAGHRVLAESLAKAIAPLMPKIQRTA
jgi:carbamoyltransferase